MNAVEKLSLEIDKSLESGATRWEIEPFDYELKKVDIKEFVIYNLRELHVSMPERLILSLYPFWKDFSFIDWKSVFDSVADDSYSKYHINHFAPRYLGIIPFPDTSNSGEPTFVGDLEDDEREYVTEDLTDDFGLSIEELEAVRRKLLSRS